MKMLELRHPYIEVQTARGVSCGGGQQFSESAMVRRCGCGIIAALDTLLYLSRWHMVGPVPYFRRFPAEGPVPFHVYTDCVKALSRRYFPMIPYRGINGLLLALGMQAFFHDQHMPFSARWCMISSRLWERIEEMLRQDLPVIMSVGPNLPLIWENHRVRFYVRTPEGRYLPAAAANAHYFTVIGMDETWLRISSWGNLYYLNRREFEDYVNHHSAGFVNNVVYIDKKN